MNKKNPEQISSENCQSKTEESKGCNYHLLDLKSDCKNGIKTIEQIDRDIVFLLKITQI
jgi:hypothetical protein